MPTVLQIISKDSAIKLGIITESELRALVGARYDDILYIALEPRQRREERSLPRD